ILLTGLPSLAWSHRKSPAPSARARRLTACDSRESSKSICKEIALQRPKTGKFDYLSGPNHPAQSIAFKFFTDDWNMPRTRRDGTPARRPNNRRLSNAFINTVRPDPDRVVVFWDTVQRGLALAVQPSGHLAWKCVYTIRGRGPRWYHMGNARA